MPPTPPRKNTVTNGMEGIAPTDCFNKKRKNMI